MKTNASAPEALTVAALDDLSERFDVARRRAAGRLRAAGLSDAEASRVVLKALTEAAGKVAS